MWLEITKAGCELIACQEKEALLASDIVLRKALYLS